MRYSNKEEFKREFKKRVYNFSIQLVYFIEELPKSKTSFIIGDQLLRSGTSIGANVVEAQGASSKRDFTNFLSYAFKSANETRYWIGLLRDTQKANKIKAEKLLKEAEELSKILSSIILSLKGKK
ncbi:MAG: four helix bundle protein [Patescibacteria group bacterium]